MTLDLCGSVLNWTGDGWNACEEIRGIILGLGEMMEKSRSLGLRNKSD